MKKLLTCCALMSASLPALADTFWNHNGSIMRLQAYGNNRVFSYEVPTNRMAGAGVDSGTVLFDGVRQGNKYYGTARVFSKYCAVPIEYRVTGTVVTERKVVLRGTRKSYAAGCRPTGRYTTDVLEFTYIGNRY
ncbi:hypothetical protein [uncultured Moraxella sp.]|uniref:hypothetical protein n=1 Tax=uncultured Moraxella sp. TaxID=263769 RepID=UPI0025D43897|nr:hypothetical protein [uncultured Moraxella sp.]